VRLLLQLADQQRRSHTNANGQTALILAASNGHSEVVRALLSSDLASRHEVKECDRNVSAIILAVYNGHEETARVLIDGGAEFNLHHLHSGAALIHAADTGCVGLVRLLLRVGKRERGPNFVPDPVLLTAVNGRKVNAVKVRFIKLRNQLKKSSKIYIHFWGNALKIQRQLQ
jgi:ankyrin repeat protein